MQRDDVVVLFENTYTINLAKSEVYWEHSSGYRETIPFAQQYRLPEPVVKRVQVLLAMTQRSDELVEATNPPTI